MICAIGVRPDACATAYSLALRSLVNTADSPAAIRFRRCSAPSGIPPPSDALQVNSRRLALLFADGGRAFSEQWQRLRC